MPISFIGAGTGRGGDSETTAPVKHASSAAGDLLLLFMVEARLAGLGSSAALPTDPGGSWIKQIQENNTLTVANGTVRITVWSVVDDGSIVVPFTDPGSTVNAYMLQVLTFRDVDTTTNHGLEVLGTPSQNAAATDLDIANGITTLTDGSMVIAYGGRQDNWGSNVALYNATSDIDTLGTVSGITFVEAFEANTSEGGDTGFVCNYGEKATAGSVAAATFTWATNTPASTESVGVYFALKPTGGGGGAPTVRMLGSTGVGT